MAVKHLIFVNKDYRDTTAVFLPLAAVSETDSARQQPRSSGGPEDPLRVESGHSRSIELWIISSTLELTKHLFAHINLRGENGVGV